MSEQRSAPWLSPEQAALLRARSDMVLRILNGDSPALALDVLLSVYATVAVGFGKTEQAARMLQVASGILAQNRTVEDVQKAVEAVPVEVFKVAMPDRPPGPLPAGYSTEDIERVEVMVRSILDLVEGEKAHNGLSALVTCYAQVADHCGDGATAGRVLIETGSSMLARANAQPAQAGAPVPTTSAKLH